MSVENKKLCFNATSDEDEKNIVIGLCFSHTVFLTLFVVILVIFLSSLAYYLVKKRAVNNIKHQLVPLYHFDPGEFENWEDEFTGDISNEKTRFGHQFYRSFSSPAITTSH